MLGVTDRAEDNRDSMVVVPVWLVEVANGTNPDRNRRPVGAAASMVVVPVWLWFVANGTNPDRNRRPVGAVTEVVVVIAGASWEGISRCVRRERR